MRHINNYDWYIRCRGALGAGTQRQQVLEGRRPPRRGRVEPDAREGSRPEVPGKRLLRSPRCRAGQIRDAASGLGGEGVGDRCVRRIRRVAADLLSSQGRLRGRGDRGAGGQKRGPRGPHKIQSEVLAFVMAQLVPGEPIRARELAKSIHERFGLDVHPRTIERAVRGKKTPR